VVDAGLDRRHSAGDQAVTGSSFVHTSAERASRNMDRSPTVWP
jgi:hypothetical protein